jgi:hypothetical protein
MHRKHLNPFVSLILILTFVALACSTSYVQPTPTSKPKPTNTASVTPEPTQTLRPTSTTRPTMTPNAEATQHQTELEAEAQAYFDQGYLASADGKFMEYEDFKEEWAQLGWYSWWVLGQNARDFYISAHFKWTSAYRSADISGCGFAFAIQEDEDHYAVFLDRSKVYFVETAGYFMPVGPTRGTGRVDFGNPFDEPVEADFTLIVKDAYAYVLVDGEVVGEYTLSQSKKLRGGLGLTLLSGTNKDFGTRCEMTNLRVWTPFGG